MNKAVEFTRKVIMMAKEEGLACMVMAGGAYGFTGDLSQILGENNTATGMIGETYYEVSDETLKIVCFKDLMEFMSNKDVLTKEMICAVQKTRISSDLGLNLGYWFREDRKSMVIFNVLSPKGEKDQFIMDIHIEDDMVEISPRPDWGVSYKFKPTDTMVPSLKKMHKDVPAQILQAVGEFLIQCMTITTLGK